MDEVGDRSVPSWPRLIAVVLALGGSYWGVLLLLVFGPAVLFPVPFGIGYVVVAGYIVRAVSVPSLGTRRGVWVVSLAVQGAWLCAGLTGGLAQAADKPIPLLWWGFATVASAIALVAERPDGTPNQAFQQTSGA